MVNLKNKQTLYPDSVGAVFLLGGGFAWVFPQFPPNRTRAEYLTNSKVYHK